MTTYQPLPILCAFCHNEAGRYEQQFAGYWWRCCKDCNNAILFNPQVRARCLARCQRIIQALIAESGSQEGGNQHAY